MTLNPGYNQSWWEVDTLFQGGIDGQKELILNAISLLPKCDLGFSHYLFSRYSLSPITCQMGFPSGGGQVAKNLPAMQKMQEMQVQSLGGEDPLEEGMAIHSSILAWRSPWTEEPGRLLSIGSERVRHD